MWNLLAFASLYAASKIKSTVVSPGFYKPVLSGVKSRNVGAFDNASSSVNRGFEAIYAVKAVDGGVSGDFYSDHLIWNPPSLFSDASAYVNFENWVKWIQLPSYAEPLLLVQDIAYVQDGKSTVPFNLDNVERKTPNILLDIRMRVFGDLISVDDSGNYLPPYSFTVAGKTGYIPYSSYKVIVTRLAVIDKMFNGDNWQYIEEVRKMYFETIGVPASNVYHQPWSTSLVKCGFSQRMLQGFYWYLLKNDRFKMTFNFFPLNKNDNDKTVRDPSGYSAKYSEDGTKLFSFGTEDIARMYLSAYVAQKLGSGKSFILSKLGLKI